MSTHDTAIGQPALLVVTMGTDYIAPARMPFELQRAGFRVAMLAPRDSLAAHTVHCDLRGHFPPGARLIEWMRILVEWIRSVDPLMVLPGDDVTVRTLMRLVLDPPIGMPAALTAELRVPIVRSLGDPAGWIDSIDKSRLFELARAHGIPVADGDIGTSEDEAIAVASRLGYPVIVRPSFGAAGSGSARCASPGDVRAAFRAVGPPNAWCPPGPPRFVVQRWIDGVVMTRASLAWNGREVAGISRGRLATYPNALGVASVVEFAGIPEAQAATARLFELTGMHGFILTQYIVEAATGTPYLIEVNRRMGPTTHSGPWVGIDLAQALRTMLDGKTWTGPQDLPPGPGLRMALFPQEWYRDDASRWLGTLPSDAPWHDPSLFEAMVRLRPHTIPDQPVGTDAPIYPSSGSKGDSS